MMTGIKTREKDLAIIRAAGIVTEEFIVLL